MSTIKESSNKHARNPGLLLGGAAVTIGAFCLVKCGVDFGVERLGRSLGEGLIERERQEHLSQWNGGQPITFLNGSKGTWTVATDPTRSIPCVDPAIAASGPSAAQQALLDQGWGFLHTTFLDQNGAAVDPLTLWATLRPLSEGEQPRNLRSLADIFVHFDAIQGPRPSAISFTMLHREGVSEWRISITDPEHRKLFARTLPQLPTKKLDSSLVAYARAGINWNPSGAPEVTGETVIPGICLANGFSTRFAPGQTDQSTGLVLPGVPDLVYLSFMGGAPQGKNYVVNLVMGLEGLSRRGPRGESGGIRFEVLYFENGVQKEPPIPTVVVEIDR